MILLATIVALSAPAVCALAVFGPPKGPSIRYTQPDFAPYAVFWRGSKCLGGSWDGDA